MYLELWQAVSSGSVTAHDTKKDHAYCQVQQNR